MIKHLGDFGDTISVYLVNNALIDPGPYSIMNDVLNAIKDIDIKLEDIRYIILTHLHIDHSGNTWALLNYMPNAKVVIHYKAIKYLAEPTVLINSSKEVLGSIIDRWGNVKPIDEQRFIGIKDNDTLKLEQQTLRFIETPGHAPFHMSILIDDELFTGDALGIKYKDTLRPASPLPSFRLDLALESIKKIKELKPKRLYLPHFGVIDNAENFIEDNIRVYNDWAKIIEESLKEGKNEDEILSILNIKFGYDILLKNEFTNRLILSDLRGFMKYIKNKVITSQ